MLQVTILLIPFILAMFSSRISQSGKKMQMSTYERIFHLTLYGKLIVLTIFIVIHSPFRPFTSPLVLEQEEISGWREDLFTARKSAINLLGVISVSKVTP
jgi:hypothetical protein